MGRFKGFSPEFAKTLKLSITYERRFLIETVKEMVVFSTSELVEIAKRENISKSTVYNFIGLLVKDNQLEKQDNFCFTKPVVEPKISDAKKLKKVVEDLFENRHITSYGKEKLIEAIKEVEDDNELKQGWLFADMTGKEFSTNK